MNGKSVFVLSALILLTALMCSGFTRVDVKATNDNPVLNLDTGLNYATIQEAIDAPETLDGHSIFVKSGSYYETVVLRKDLSLFGEDKNTTIIDAKANGTVICIENVSYCRITGFTLRNSSRWYSPYRSGLESSGICVVNSRGVVLDRNILRATRCGIYFACSSNSIIYDNVLTVNDDYDIYLDQSNNIIINQNFILNSGSSFGSIFLNSSFHNIIDRNTISSETGNAITLENSFQNLVQNNWLNDNGWDGIDLLRSSKNTIIGNTIEKNWRGIVLDGANDNRIYGNSFIDNEKDPTYTTVQVVIYGSNVINAWDNGTLGNYWSDYKGQDLDNDTIGDTSYVINGENQDNHPLMNPCIIPQEKLQALYNDLRTDDLRLRQEYNDLKLKQEQTTNELNTDRILMYSFAVTTAVSLTLLAPIYLRLTKQKVKTEDTSK